MTHSPDDVVIKLPRDMALALFEWAYRFMETQDPTFTHPADAVVVDRIASELEWELPEVRTEAYPSLLRSSRESVVAGYRSRLGQSHAAWLDALRYQDVEP